jgi:anti-sigma regulatory factor (Ser/Thr protein kinase)
MCGVSGLRKRGEQIRAFILKHVSNHPGDIARLASEKFGITRQAVSKHLSRMVGEGALLREGNTRSRHYKLSSEEVWNHSYRLSESKDEDLVLRQDILPHLGDLPHNILNIWGYGFTEMFNNVVDHSGAKRVKVMIRHSPGATMVILFDNGVGIFRKIKNALGLLDERHSVLELAKGKLTTDPVNHSGQGIFFTSRMFDRFAILSGNTIFNHDFGDDQDWILDLDLPKKPVGTIVLMVLNNHTSRTPKQIFDQFSSGDDYAFNKTMVPVQMAQYGDELLVSRSQAKRLLARVDRFHCVIFDFEAVDSIGQAFADEIFRVFANRHPQMVLEVAHANLEVQQMIRRAQAQDR